MTCRREGSTRRSGTLDHGRQMSLDIPRGPSHHGGDARQELGDGDRFGDVVVGPVGERGDLVRLSGGRGDEKNRGAGIDVAAADCAAQRNAVKTTQGGIEHDELEARFIETVQRLTPVRAHVDREAIDLEMVRQQQPGRQIAIGDERALSCV